jgi:hypothetical protein
MDPPSRLRFEAAVLRALARAPSCCMSLSSLAQVPDVAASKPLASFAYHVWRIDDVSERDETDRRGPYAILDIPASAAERIAAECDRRAGGDWYSCAHMLRLFSEPRLSFVSAVLNALAKARMRRLTLAELNAAIAPRFALTGRDCLGLLDGAVDILETNDAENPVVALRFYHPIAAMLAKGYVRALEDAEARFQAAVQRLLERAPDLTMSLSDLGSEESVSAFHDSRKNGKLRTRVEAIPGVYTVRIPRGDSEWGGVLHAYLED